jgi:putative molybdopterin biosynthesis protein
MMRQEAAGRLRTFADVVQSDLRFVNRQAGSGTRMLIEHLLQEHSIAPASWSGYADHVENTHVAVGLCVASGVADVGIGIEAAALQFGLHFVPLVEEDYFLACRSDALDHPAVQRMCEVLAGPGWAEILKNLPGYRPAANPGALLNVEQILSRRRRADR